MPANKVVIPPPNIETIHVLKTPSGYRWNHDRSWDDLNSNNCIMACYRGYSITSPTSDYFLVTGKQMPSSYYRAIANFDNWNGTNKDLGFIRRLARRLGMKVEVVK